MSSPQVLHGKILRSINIQYDATHSERIEHFRPTAKTVQLLRALTGLEDERAFFVIAPYGSGKSLTGSYALQLVENRSEAQETLRIIEERLKKINPAVASFASSRRKEEERGLVLALEGFCSSLPDALQEALAESLERHHLSKDARWVGKKNCVDMNAILKLFKETATRLKKHGFDRVVVLWDEFGRHLETLITKGRETELNYIQQLAEFSSRHEQPFVLGLLLHQQLLQYAGSLS